MKRTLASLLTLALFLCTAPAYAGSYMKGQIGAYFPEENDFDTGLNLQASLGTKLGDLFPEMVRINPGLEPVSAELGLGYYQSSFDEKETFAGVTSSVDADLDVIPLTLTGYYTLPLQGTNFELYGGLGLGLYLAFLEVEAEVSDPLLGTTFRSSDDETELELGMDFHLGGTYNISPQLGIQAEFEYDFVTEDIGGAFLNVGVQYNF